MSDSRQAKHDPSRNGYQKEYQKKRYHSRMTEAKKLLGGKCSKCDATSSLELDHKNPKNKNFNISKLWSVPEDEFKREVKKCRLLCRKHHLENTGKQRENGEVKSEPGKSQYKNNRKKKSASARLFKLAESFSMERAVKLAADVAKEISHTFDHVDVKLATNFKKSDRLDTPTLTFNVFDAEEGGHQLLFRIYGREKDANAVASIQDAVKNALVGSKTEVEYEDDLSEPGLLVKVVSVRCP